MPVFLAIVRVALCAICSGQWHLESGENPESCAHCGSTEWLWGVESRDTRLIRQGISRLRKPINPGAKSKKRQDQGKRQWRQFRPKPEEETDDNKKEEKTERHTSS